MLCQRCGERPATVHVTRIVNGVKTEIHLCPACAESSEMALFAPSPFSIHNLLGGLLHPQPEAGRAQAELRCPTCGTTYEEFARTSFLGCETCYTAFAPQLEPLLRRIQGADRHRGKRPVAPGRREQAAAGGTAPAPDGASAGESLAELRRQLDEAVRQEEYERAALLRDRIRALEGRDPAG
ncbi:MAG: UvrB/UvrC motif-containing protein, partial [Clostridia bacterium]|nr:UvrB/UvrC motif-containing protein [Clostridia bacterium]